MHFVLTTDTHYGWNSSTSNHHHKRLKSIKNELDCVGSKVLLHTGDWACNRQRQVYRSFEMFRSYLGSDIRILAVLGNHDFWQDPKEDSGCFESTLLNHRAWARKFSIELLDSASPVFFEDVAVIGFDGWYGNEDISDITNDVRWLPGNSEAAHQFLRERARGSFSSLMSLDTSKARAVIGLTHMPPEPGELNNIPESFLVMANKCQVICHGHSHKRRDEKVGQVRYLNAGSDYGKINFLSFEV